MSVRSEITRIANAVADAYDAVDEMGGTLPANEVVGNLADAILTIPKGGGGSAISVVDTQDSHGGTIRTITAVDLSEDTVTAAHLETGYTAHDSSGNPIVGTMSPGSGGSGGDYNVISVNNGDGTQEILITDASGGGGSVNFVDYDGTILYSYTASEFANLSSMPSNPSHTGLVAQGWNWSLSDAKAHVAKYGSLHIGQMYVTTSGKTEIDIVLDDSDYLSPYLCLCPNGTVEIDWGDGSTGDTMTGTSTSTAIYRQHVYARTGSYTISIDVVSGECSTFTHNASSSIARKQMLLSPDTSTTYLRNVYTGVIIHIRIGNLFRLSTGAFRNCENLTYITIPDSVTSIGTYAFSYCTSLQSITIPDSVTRIGNYVFYGCSELQSITIPDGVTSIGDCAFLYCTSLRSITIPDGVTSIVDYAFRYCTSLQSITIPDGVTSIGTSAFEHCYSLQSITIPDGVTSIANYAFRYCTSLRSIIVPDSVTSIANYVFYGCSELQSIIIPDGVTSIGTYAFSYCTSLRSFTIPDGVTSIVNYTFRYCYSLQSITIPDGVTSIGDYAFANCTSLRSITIPDSVVSMGTYVFYGCSALRSSTISDSVTSIGNYVFYSCSVLRSITIPDSVESMGTYVFYGCSELQSITVPDSVTRIGASAFYNCPFYEIYFKPITPPTVSAASAFTGIPSSCIIYVPTGTLSAYTSATNYPSSSTYTYVEYDP